MFEEGVSYTRAEIFAQVGGSMEIFLPNFGGRVVAACLRIDENPGAPDIILAGTGSGIERAANLLASQRSPIPTFLKGAVGEWEYVGDYVPERASREPDELAAQSRLSGRSDITQIIYMARASEE